MKQIKLVPGGWSRKLNLLPPGKAYDWECSGDHPSLKICLGRNEIKRTRLSIKIEKVLVFAVNVGQRFYKIFCIGLESSGLRMSQKPGIDSDSHLILVCIPCQ